MIRMRALVPEAKSVAIVYDFGFHAHSMNKTVCSPALEPCSPATCPSIVSLFVQHHSPAPETVQQLCGTSLCLQDVVKQRCMLRSNLQERGSTQRVRGACTKKKGERGDRA